MTRSRSWKCLQWVAGAALLAIVFERLGTGPFLDAVRAVDVRMLVAVTGIAALTTVCSAWRWCIIARGLGAGVSLQSAVAAYYRSQFLNTVLPGGVLGDVHRAVGHGRRVADLGLGVRTVAWERAAGQAVQIALTLLALVVLPSPVRSLMPMILAALVAAALMIGLLRRAVPADATGPVTRLLRAVARDLRAGVLSRQTLPGVVLTSVVVVTGHAATFLIAARAVGSTASVGRLLPMVLLVLLAMALPINIAGWGPREAMAAAAFGAAGLSASQGLAASVVYGILVLVASSPGGVFLLVASFTSRPSLPAVRQQAQPEGAVRG